MVGKSAKPKVVKRKTPESNSLQKYFDRLNDTNKFISVKPEFMKDLPIQTHIGYIYMSSKGDFIPIISAFIQSHYVSEGGLSGMMIKCGNRTYANLYKSIVKIFIYRNEYEKVAKIMKHNKLHNPPKPSPEEIALRIQQLEKTLSDLKMNITRSTSMVQLPKPVEEPIKKPKAKPKRPSSLTHPEKKKSKPVRF